MFERWSSAQIELHRAQPRSRGRARADAGLSPASVKVYQSIWRGWLEWLASERLPWNGVAPADIERFLASRAPSEEGRPAINRVVMAQYTRQRYFRVLQGVYHHATLLGLIEDDPVSAVAQEGHQPHMRAVDQLPQMLPPGSLELLRSSEWLVQTLPMESTREWWVLRDRACVALVAHCGLTTRELRTLQGRDLRCGTGVYHPSASAHLPAMEPAHGLFVDIRESKDRVARSVPLPSAALEVLDPWLAARRTQLLLQRHRRSSLDGAAGECTKISVPKSYEHAPLLLASERNAAKTPGNGELTAGMLYRVFRTCLRSAYAQSEVGIAPDQYVATGAAIVRNSVIARWVMEQPENAAELAGLKSVAAWRSVRGTAPDRALM